VLIAVINIAMEERKLEIANFVEFEFECHFFFYRLFDQSGNRDSIRLFWILQVCA